MPNAVLRVLLAITALVAVLLMAGVGAGLASADPEDPASENPSETGTPADPPPISEPQPVTTTPPSIFDIPNTIVGHLRDLVGRPLSVFGNGRVPGTHTVPDLTTPNAQATTSRKRSKPAAEPVEPPSEPIAPIDDDPPAPVRRPSSAVDVTLPFSPLISVPVPNLLVPGYETLRWTLNLTDPYTAYASVQETVTTVNSLLSDALAPYNPFKPPPRPEPTFRILEEEPVVDAGGTGSATALSDASPQLPVVQAPMVVPPIQIAPPRPVSGSAPAGSQVVGTDGAGVRAPAVRDSVAPTGSAPAGSSPAGSAATGQPPSVGSTPAVSVAGPGNPPIRDGYPGYLRSARISQVATVAIPGLAGLIAITASGGVIGYRQANSGRYLRSDTARFLQ